MRWWHPPAAGLLVPAVVWSIAWVMFEIRSRDREGVEINRREVLVWTVAGGGSSLLLCETAFALLGIGRGWLLVPVSILAGLVLSGLWFWTGLGRYREHDVLVYAVLWSASAAAVTWLVGLTDTG